MAGIPYARHAGRGGALGGLCGLVLGLPSLRLPGFYFAMATMAFALIVGEIVARAGSASRAAASASRCPAFPAPFDTPHGFYSGSSCASRCFVTWLTWNVARLMWGRAADRDPRQRGGRRGGRRAAVLGQAHRLRLQRRHRRRRRCAVRLLQSYITPDTFVFELGLFFFVCIIIGGRGSILGPFLGTVVLTALAGAGGAAGQARQLLLRAAAARRRAAGPRRHRPRWSRCCASGSGRADGATAGRAGPAAAGPRDQEHRVMSANRSRCRSRPACSQARRSPAARSGAAAATRSTAKDITSNSAA